jgi:flagellar protein FlbD
MIVLHRLNGSEFILNDDHIEIMEARPDTTITLANEKLYIVKEPLDEVLRLIGDSRRAIFVKEKNE